MDGNVLAGSNQPVLPAPGESSDAEKDLSAETQKDTENKSEAEPESAPEKDAEPEKSPEPEKPEKRKSTLPPWVQELRREKRNLQRQVARLNKQIGELRAKAPPSPEQFQNEAEYQRALLRHASHEASLEQQYSTIQSEQESFEAKRQEAWSEIAAVAQSEIPDFEAAVFDPKNPVSPIMAELMLEAENPAQLAYWLAKNRATAARIARLDSPIEVARELGRIEARINAPQPKLVSNAPKPLATVGGRSHQSAPSPHKLADNMEEYAKWWEEREKRRRS